MTEQCPRCGANTMSYDPSLEEHHCSNCGHTEEESYATHIKRTAKCGICGGKAEVGPFAGGPLQYYCKDCHFKIRKFLDAQEAHEQMIKEMIEEHRVVQKQGEKK